MKHNNTDTDDVSVNDDDDDDDEDDDDDVSVKPWHKYLYSDVATTWEEASLEEQNCLVRYGRSQGYDNWYYMDGECLLCWDACL